MAWIKLHLKNDGSVVYINTNNIFTVSKSCMWISRVECKETTCVFGNCGDNDRIWVTESVEEVMSAIHSAEGRAITYCV